ncbi:MAG: bifunctional 5,10-methylenetetrahydrofolate dehydrogenase/5,10-methenyltetrahydrofolate cyclohydrolase [Clostridiales bacterium]|jgi:tetrahydrofolate dehydrogenase/cyclohydrolase, NAD(P)-binding domain protein|nr:bifunctional 5,10-methylenetetrahydrofolate dehydrogenase/5,10-methenyltetrahydrofolate cyclohydrolase [Clostridiales bacterium]
MTELKGAPVAAAITEACKKKIRELKEKNIVPTLAIVRIGARSDDEAYERGAEKRFASAGAEIKKYILPEDAKQEDLEILIRNLNVDSTIHGILLFRPLPDHMEESRIKQLIRMEKDVDGMSYAGLGGLLAARGGKTESYAPCTPQAVIELLEFYGIHVTGKKVTVVGRSAVVGLPLAVMLIHKNATVTVCHTKTQDLWKECREADIVIAAAGKAKMIGREHTCGGQVLIDVGINFVDGKMCGDIDYENTALQAAAITPVPGGVGAVTTSVLLKHTVDSAEKLC